MTEHHELHSSPGTIHWGFFDAMLQPVLRVSSGDRVMVHCVSGEPEDMPHDASMVLPELREIHRQCERQGSGPHVLTGPIWIDGAEEGDTLEVRVIRCSLRQDWGWNLIEPGHGTLPEEFPVRRLIHIPLDRERMVALPPWGGHVGLRPFFGIMGVAPSRSRGRVSSFPPGEHGGNLDNRELGEGSILYLPVWNRGGLFSVGDGHAVQGEGEVCLTAVETALTGTFEFHVRKDLAIDFPRAETPTHYVTMGTDPDLDLAAKHALRRMIDDLVKSSGMSREDGYRLCSIAAELRVTQLVDGDKGIHLMLSKDLLPNRPLYEKGR
jgi:acetamidase/formamidase